MLLGVSLSLPLGRPKGLKLLDEGASDEGWEIYQAANNYSTSQVKCIKVINITYDV